MIIDLLMISIIVCYIIDCSGFVNSLKRGLLKYLYKLNNPNPTSFRIKPVDCSKCMIFWIGLFYIIFNNELSLITITVVSLLSLVSSNISGLLMWLTELLTYLENKLYNIIS